MKTINLGQSLRNEFRNSEIEGINIKLVCTLMALEEGKVAEMHGSVIDKESNMSVGSITYNNGSVRNGGNYECTVSIQVKEYQHLQLEATELLFSSIAQIESEQASVAKSE